MPKYSYWICDLLCFGLSEIGLKMGYTPKLEVLIGKIMMNQWPLWYLIFRQTHVENMKKTGIFCLERISETSNEYQRIA